MWREIFVTTVLFVGIAIGGFPYIVPTVGQIWPQPQQIVTEQTFMVVRPSSFNFSVDGHDCDILQEALKRYRNIMFPQHQVPQNTLDSHWLKSTSFNGYLDTINITLSKECETLPYLDMDEQYSIKIDSSDAPGTGSIASQSIWGILRGLESFSQLLIPDGINYIVNSTQLTDYPRFKHRGLLIDSARHYLPKSEIYETLDLLAMNKFNVFHWHITDDQSFPYLSQTFPDLSGKGAYTQDRVYTARDVADIVEYARLRGIRVVPEFDTPAHTQSWGPGQSNLLTTCYTDGKPNGQLGPVDPTSQNNYDFLTSFFTEVSSLFPDFYLHLGGDEVNFDCWKTNPYIADFMKNFNMTGRYDILEMFYFARLQYIMHHLPMKRGYIVWQEVFDNGAAYFNDSVVQVWKGNWQEEMMNVTKAGYQALLSSCWYLSDISYGADWKNFYNCEPFSFNGTAAQNGLLIGGEACLWGEFVDKVNLIARTWPRASAVAEKLWSAEEKTTEAEGAAPRLEELRCKLLSRGFLVDALGPSFCPGDNL